MDYSRFYARWFQFWYGQVTISYHLSKLMVLALPKPRHSQTEIAGYQLELDMHDLLQANLLLGHYWEPYFAAWWAYLSRSARCVCDIGAHCGYYTLIAHRYAPAGARIHAFEPNPAMSEQLRRTIALNALKGVDIVPSAVSDIRGSIVIYVRSVLEPGATSRMQALYADKQVEADAIALDDYCDEQGIDSVDLVKMDIEGGEIFAIEGMRRGLEQGRYKAIMLELHAGKVPPGRLEALLDLLRVSGLTVYEFSDTSVLPLAEGMPESSNYVMALSADTIAAIAPDGRIEALDIPRVF